MSTSRTRVRSRVRTRLIPLAATAALLSLSAACDDDPPTAPDATAQAVATLRRVTERYHDLNVAIADGFVFLHGCEDRPGEGPVGMVYVHMDRLTDGAIDPASPDALIYEPRAGAPPSLVGIELAMPYPLWTQPTPPTFLGETFGAEDEFGVFGLHAWVWRENPRGMFATSHPHVSCAAA